MRVAIALTLLLSTDQPAPVDYQVAQAVAEIPSPATIEHWKSVWVDRVLNEYTPDLLGEWAWMSMTYPSSFPAHPYFPPSIERWRGVVARFFNADRVDAALKVMQCESEPDGDPLSKNRYSTAAGLFQFLRGTFNNVAIPMGYGSYDSGAVYHPAINIHAASVLSKGGTWWSHWRASRSCHGYA